MHYFKFNVTLTPYEIMTLCIYTKLNFIDIQKTKKNLV
jgi:hypothetical protein